MDKIVELKHDSEAMCNSIALQSNHSIYVLLWTCEGY